MTNLSDILQDANPEGKLITGAKAANLTRNILSNLDLTAHTPQDILGALRDSGIAVTIPSFYGIYSDVSGKTARSQRIKYVNQSYTPSEGVLEPALYALPTNYRIVHWIKYEDEETGLVIEREFSLDIDELLTIQEMQELATEVFQEKYPYIVLEIKTIRGYISK